MIFLGGGWYLAKSNNVISVSIVKFYNNTFAIKGISVSGTNNLSTNDVINASGLKYEKNIFGLSVDQIRKNLEKMHWVKSATVKRVIPSNFEISIVERVPIAYWQDNDKLYLVDESGVSMPTIKQFPSLPISRGANANKAIPQFVKLLKQFPLIEQQIVFCTFLGNRRWNIDINRGLLIKLPEENIAEALSILQRMGNKDGYFSSDIAVIDLRVPGRVIIGKRKVQ